MPNRRIKVSWRRLQEILQESELIEEGEEIEGITLMKPKEVLLYIRERRKEDT